VTALWLGSPAVPAAVGVEVSVLGPLRVTVDGVALPIGPPKARALLALLALHAGRCVTVSLLSEVLWGADPPRSAAKAVQLYVSLIRRTLPTGSIVTVPGGYLLDLDPAVVDAHRFELHREEGLRALSAGQPAEALDALHLCLQLWEGPALPDLVDHPRGQAEQTRLEELRCSAEEAIGEALLQLGRHATAIGDLEAAVAAEPLRERRWAQLITALYRAGRQADALRAYARLRHTLAEQLGIEPSGPLSALEAAILAHDPGLDAPSPVGADPRHSSPTHPSAADRSWPAEGLPWHVEPGRASDADLRGRTWPAAPAHSAPGGCGRMSGTNEPEPSSPPRAANPGGVLRRAHPRCARRAS